MAVNPAIWADVESRWRTLTSAEQALADVLLEDSWLELTSRLPTLSARMDAGSIMSPLVVRVLATMVLRVMRNPDGKVQESIDDYAYRRADAVADGVLYPTSSELRLLSGSPGRSVSSVRLVAYGDVAS